MKLDPERLPVVLVSQQLARKLGPLRESAPPRPVLPHGSTTAENEWEFLPKRFGRTISSNTFERRVDVFDNLLFTVTARTTTLFAALNTLLPVK
nr:hypothetical protein [Caballeronia temeraria]